MLNFNFRLNNPFSKRWNTFFYKDGLITKHKAWEIQAVTDNSIVSAEFSLSVRGDHSGVTLGVGLLGVSIMFCLVDTRHWNEEAGRHYNYESAGNAS